MEKLYVQIRSRTVSEGLSIILANLNYKPHASFLTRLVNIL